MSDGWFIWNGTDSRDMGVIVTTPAPIVYPAERAETLTVPGRPGFFTRAEGEGVYDGYIKTVGVGNKHWADPRAIAAWLRGSGTLILGSEPGFAYQARVLREASADRAFPGVYSASVSFMVQPGKAQIPQESDILITAEATPVFNPGDFPARPIYTLTGSGRMTLTITPAETQSSLVINPIDTGWEETLTGAIIDSDAMTVTTPDGEESLTGITTVYGNGHSGLWIPPRATVYISAGVTDEYGSLTSVLLTPRWRWL